MFDADVFNLVVVQKLLQFVYRHDTSLLLPENPEDPFCRIAISVRSIRRPWPNESFSPRTTSGAGMACVTAGFSKGCVVNLASI
jgi:hypothetical protein